MVPFLQLYLNSVNNTPCPRVYTLLRLCSSLCFATKGMSVVAATNVVVDPPLERKRKNLLARRFLFHRALLADLLLPFSLFTRRIFEGVSPRLVAWPDFQPSSPRSWRRVLVLPRWNILDFDADWFYQRETEKGEGRREELRLVRGLKLFWFSLERGIIY